MAKILVTGSNGLCGRAIRKYASDHDFIFTTREDGDLRKCNHVRYLFQKFRPNYVIHAGSKVGGIGGNEAMHADFYYDNIMMNTNIIKNCLDFGVSKLMMFSSVCVFPNDLALLEEDKVHNGPVFSSNFAYGYAKRMSDVYIQAAKKQYGITNYTSIIPSNIFGENDLYSEAYGHIIPSLMVKLRRAIETNSPFYIWGDGKSMREFIYADDLAQILLKLIDMDYPDKIIISGRKEYSIKEVVDLLCQISGFKGDIIYETNKPNGQRSRPTSKKVIDSLVKFEYTPFPTALKKAWDWFNDNYPNIRMNYVS